MRLPASVSITSWLGELIKYIAAFEPDVHRQLHPVSDKQIDLLTQLTPIPLPVAYRQFLDRFGRVSATLFPKFQARIGLDASLELYREMATEALSEEVFLIGYGFNSIYPELGLHVAGNPEHPPVVASDDSEILYTLSESLPHLLFQQVFLGHEIMSHPTRRVYGLTREGPALAEIAEHCLNQNFTACEFSDAQHCCARRDDAALLIHQIQDGPGWLYLGGKDAESCQTLGDDLARVFDLPFMRQEPE